MTWWLWLVVVFLVYCTIDAIWIDPHRYGYGAFWIKKEDD